MKRLLRWLFRCRHRCVMGWVRYAPDIGHYRRCECGARVPCKVEFEHRVLTKVSS